MFIMISCRRASELMSQQLDRPLSFSEKARLRTHLLICRSCPKTLEQFEILRHASQQYMQPKSHEPKQTLDEQAKQRILAKLQGQTKSTGPSNESN